MGSVANLVYLAHPSFKPYFSIRNTVLTLALIFWPKTKTSHDHNKGTYCYIIHTLTRFDNSSFSTGNTDCPLSRSASVDCTLAVIFSNVSMFWRSNSRGLIRACVYCVMLNWPASWDCMTVIFKSFRSRFWNGGECRIDTEQKYILLALVCREQLKVKTQDLLECRIAGTLIITFINCSSMLGLNNNNLNRVFKLQTWI